MKKSTKNSKTFFFEDKPLFGLDIGHDMLRVMQFDLGHKLPRLKGYGSAAFDVAAIADGVIVKPELIAKAAVGLFRKGLIGDISTKRVAVSLPASRAFTRALQLPKMGPKDIDEAVRTEAEQYIPVNIDNLYLDYTVLGQSDDSMDVLVVAMSKAIVDSYLTLTRMLGLEAVLFDTAIGASAHLFAYDPDSGIPSVLVDFGAEVTDISVFNHGLVVTGSVAFGGDDITATLARELRMSEREALILKSKYGLSPSTLQKQVIRAVGPSLEQLIKEIRRTIRYYEQRYAKEPPIGQIVIMGGGANMPGLADYLTEQLRVPARAFDLTSHIEYGHLNPIHTAEHMTYVTAAGLAVTNPAEVFV